MGWTDILGGNTVLDNGFKLIDNAFHTDQERAAEKIKLLETMTAFKIAQRLLAREIFFMFKVLFFIEVILGLLGAKYPIAWQMVSVLNSLDPVQMLGYAFLAVVALYFTGGVVNGFTGFKK